MFSLIPFLVSGILLGLSTNQMAGIPLSPLAWICLVPLFFGLKYANSLKSHFINGNVFAFIFLLFAGIAFALASFWEGSLLILVSSLLFSIPVISIGVLRKYMSYRKSLLFLPLIWPVFDWYFIEKFIAMPNLSVSMNQAFLPWLIQYIDITGYTGVTFWLVSLNVLLFFTLDDWIYNHQKKGDFLWLSKRLALLTGLFFLPPIIYNTYITAQISPKLTDSVTVSVVQSAYADIDTLSDSLLISGLTQYIQLTDSIVQADQPDIILWPEGAVPVDFKQEKTIQQLLFRKVLEWETPLLTGTIDSYHYQNEADIPELQQYLQRDFKFYNSAVLITPQLAWRVLNDGIDISMLHLYRKQNLMHFTEYVPMSETFPALSKLGVDLGGTVHFSKGDGPTALRFADRKESVINVSPIICWDLLFSSTSSKSSSQRNDYIAALTNENPFGDAFTTSSHVVESFTRLRSIENRRSIAKSSTVGYSLFTDPFGNVHGRIPWYSTEAATGRISLSTITTFYNRHPNLFPLLCLIAFCILLSKEFWTKFKNNHN